MLALRPYAHEVGSVHKFVSMFDRALRSEGLPSLTSVVAADEGEAAAAIRTVRPSLVLCSGDQRRQWMAASDANIPYILVEHDVASMRTGAGHEAEKPMLEGAAAVLFTSSEHRDYCAALYDLPPNEIVSLRPFAAALDFSPLPATKRPSLVYAGGLVRWKERTGKYGFRCYRRIFEAFMQAGWEVHVFPCYLTTAQQVREYAKMGCVMHQSVPQVALAHACSRFTAGLQAFADEGCNELAFAYTQSCRPNKLWEYLASGIPTIGYQGGRGMALYDGRWGTVLEDLADIDALVLPEIAEDERRTEVIDSDLDVFVRVLQTIGYRG